MVTQALEVYIYIKGRIYWKVGWQFSSKWILWKEIVEYKKSKILYWIFIHSQRYLIEKETSTTSTIPQRSGRIRYLWCKSTKSRNSGWISKKIHTKPKGNLMAFLFFWRSIWDLFYLGFVFSIYWGKKAKWFLVEVFGKWLCWASLKSTSFGSMQCLANDCVSTCKVL